MAYDAIKARRPTSSGSADAPPTSTSTTSRGVPPRDVGARPEDGARAPQRGLHQGDLARWHHELELMVKSKVKAEILRLTVRVPVSLSQVYLPKAQGGRLDLRYTDDRERREAAPRNTFVDRALAHFKSRELLGEAAEPSLGEAATLRAIADDEARRRARSSVRACRGRARSAASRRGGRRRAPPSRSARRARGELRSTVCWKALASFAFAVATICLRSAACDGHSWPYSAVEILWGRSSSAGGSVSLGGRRSRF